MDLSDEDRAAWDKWSAMPHRRLLAPPKVDVVGNLGAEIGEPVMVTISQNPPQYSDRPWRKSEVCPVCGETTAGMSRLPACLHPKFECGFSYGLGVWVHQTCFDHCPDAAEPTPIPW